VVESRAAIINTKRVDFSPLLHYSGIQPRAGIFPLGLMCDKSEYVCHYWVDTMAEAYERGRRYIPYEAERRHQKFKHFSLRFMLYEFYKFLSKNLKTKAIRSKISRQILYFDLWYLVKAYKVWISYERKLKQQAKVLKKV
ncbi:MAG: hypothetical protein MUO40_05125, partial [Anaerolineaceae bacterium]|nr:hypothetical protein [Anaerolineaceae bacterium]